MTIAADFNLYEYKNCSTSWRDRPAVRINAILRRLSRDKYIPPNQVCEIGRHIAWKLSGKPERSFEAAISIDCMRVGMIRGLPPLFSFEPGFKELCSRLHDKRKKVDPEIHILNVIIETKLNQHRRKCYAK